MTNHEDPLAAIELGLALAQRWGVIVVPDHVTVKASGWSFTDGLPGGPQGTIELLGQTAPAGEIRLVDCSFQVTSIADTVANLVVWLRDQLAASFDREDG